MRRIARKEVRVWCWRVSLVESPPPSLPKPSHSLVSSLPSCWRRKRVMDRGYAIDGWRGEGKWIHGSVAVSWYSAPLGTDWCAYRSVNLHIYEAWIEFIFFSFLTSFDLGILTKHFIFFPFRIKLFRRGGRAGERACF